MASGANMGGRELTALMIAPNRALADQFAQSLGKVRTFQIVGDLKSYPNEQTLDMRLRQLRPDVVLVDLSTDLERAGELIKLLASLRPPVHTIGIHTQNDSEAILRSLRSGASEFLYAPFDVSIQEAAVARIQRLLQPEGSADRESGRLVVFSSAKPGSGASTLAAQTAFALKRTTGKRVLLADFDLMGGTIGFNLKLDQDFSLVDVLQKGERMDTALWNAMTVNSAGISVLTSPDLPYTDSIDPNRLHDILQFARLQYDWVVVDLPSIFHRLSLLLLSESDRAFLVSTSELASLHLARKAVKLLTHLGFDSHRYQVLINRIDKRDGLNSSDLSKLFHCPVDASLPNDYFSLHRVVTLGESLDGESELGRAIEGLASKLVGALPPEKRVVSGLLVNRPVYLPM